MKMLLFQAINIKNVLGKMTDEKMPVKLAYKIMKFISAVETEEKFFNEKTAEIIQKYALRGEDGNFIFIDDSNVKIDPEKYDECEKESRELQELEIEVNEIKLSLEDFRNIKLTPKELYVLAPILADEE